MKQSRWRHGILGGLCLVILCGCADIRPLWKGEQALESLTLYFSEPLEFTIRIPPAEQPVRAMLELALTYDQGINRTSLPLFLTLETPDHQVQEINTLIPLKEDGQWLGIPEENEVDYTITHVVAQDLRLEPNAPYELKLYANDESQEKMYGIIRVVLRVYAMTDLEGE